MAIELDINKEYKIVELQDEAQLQQSVETIRKAFITVTGQFNITEQNCPTNPAFQTYDRLKAMKEKGIRMFGLYHGDGQVGFVAVEKAGDTLYYMERLAVIPEYRHGGLGVRLMDFVFGLIKEQNGEKVSIAVINENLVLKNWYKDYGFLETGVKNFEHLPFAVCFMEKMVG